MKEYAHVTLRACVGPLNDLNRKLSGDDGQEWLDAFKRFIRKENPWPKKIVKLLAFRKKVKIPAVKAFNAKEKFAIGTQDGVVIGWHDDNFKEHFLNGAGKSEIDVPEVQLRVHQLRKGSVRGPIIKELGGEEIVETNLATMFEAMKKQGSGQAGDLLVNGKANIFYIRDDSGTLWTVVCYLRSDYRDWNIETVPITYPGDWDAGDRVFSR